MAAMYLTLAVAMLSQCWARELIDAGGLGVPAPPVFPKSFEVRGQTQNLDGLTASADSRLRATESHHTCSKKRL